MRNSIRSVVALVLAASGTAAAADGAAIYKQHCVACHGETGTSDTPAGNMLKVPPLAGDAKVAGMSDADVQQKIRANSKHGTFVKKLTDEDVVAVGAYVKSLAAGK